jgi:Ca2+-binding EF-hand superfamily protein
MLRSAIVLASFLSSAACVTPPERQDPFSSLRPVSSAYKDLTVGLVLSDNTKNAMQYAENYGEKIGGLGDPRVTKAASQLFQDIAVVFQRNFKAAVKIEKVDEAKAVNADLVAVLDIFMEFPNSFLGDVKVDTKAIFLAPDNKEIDAIQVKDVQGAYKYALGVSAATEEAAKTVRNKLESSILGSVKLAEFSKAKTAASTAVAAKQPTSLMSPGSDVDTLPSVVAKSRKHAYAVVIGIEQYREKLPKADFAAGDAKLMGEYLTKVLGYPEDNVVLRVNDKAAKTDLEKYLGEWLRNNVEAGGSVFVYYSGHGAPNPKTGEAYLVPYDGDPSFVESTAYPLKQLYASLDKLPAKEIVVVLDSCFSGAGGRSVLAKGARPMGIALENAVASTGKAVVLAASSGDQISSTYEEKGHGLLTYFFLKGLQGEGDLNKDGAIELAELYEYLKPNVQRVARKQYNNEQTPQLLASPELLRKGGGRLIERVAP